MEATKLAIDFILNLFFISIPQNILVLFLILFLSKEYVYFKRNNFKRTFLDVLIMGALPSGFFMNWLYYYTDLNLTIRLILNVIIYFIFAFHIISYNYRKTEYDNYLKAFKPYKTTYEERFEPRITLTDFNKLFRRETSKYIFTVEGNSIRLKYKNIKRVLAVSILMVALIYTVEVSIILYLQYMFNLDMTSLSSNIINSIFIICPELILFLFCIYLGYVYVNTNNITLFKVWRDNKNFRILTYIQSITTFIFTIVVYFIYNRTEFFHGLNPDIVYKLDTTLFTFLILHILIPWALVFKNELKKYNVAAATNNL